MMDKIREAFPSLSRKQGSRPLVYLDGPAGSQVPEPVIDAIADYYCTSNANTHGWFVTSQETDYIIEEARNKAATFLGAQGGHTISFGPNMTNLNFSLSKAIGRLLNPGDEILITQLDHESNRAPWLALREKGVIVREVNLRKDGILDYEDFKKKLTERTRLVAVGYASNLLGTVNDIPWIRKLTYGMGAWLLVDAVHQAPHFPINVQTLGCDFLLCSAYKFYGPHVGILYCKPGLLDQLPTDRLCTQDQRAPYRIETGTQHHAAIAGVTATIDFIATLGQGETERERLKTAMEYIHDLEYRLGAQLYNGLKEIEYVKVIGPSFEAPMRTPTLSFTMQDISPKEVCRRLAEYGVCAWAGHFYALRAVEVLGLLEQDGVSRMGICIYNTEEEIDYTLDAVRKIANTLGMVH